MIKNKKNLYSTLIISSALLSAILCTPIKTDATMKRNPNSPNNNPNHNLGIQKTNVKAKHYGNKGSLSKSALSLIPDSKIKKNLQASLSFSPNSSDPEEGPSKITRIAFPNDPGLDNMLEDLLDLEEELKLNQNILTSTSNLGNTDPFYTRSVNSLSRSDLVIAENTGNTSIVPIGLSELLDEGKDVNPPYPLLPLNPTPTNEDNLNLLSHIASSQNKLPLTTTDNEFGPQDNLRLLSNVASSKESIPIVIISSDDESNPNSPLAPPYPTPSSRNFDNASLKLYLDSKQEKSSPGSSSPSDPLNLSWNELQQKVLNLLDTSKDDK